MNTPAADRALAAISANVRRVPPTQIHPDTGLPHGVIQPESMPGLWVAKVNMRGHRIHLGVYASSEEAYAARRGALALRDYALRNGLLDCDPAN